MSKKKIYEFEGADVIVRWDRARCIHTEKCVHGSPEAFDPSRRPWIEPDRVGEAGSRTQVLAINPPPAKETGEIIEDEDTNETVEKIVAWLDERKLI